MASIRSALRSSGRGAGGGRSAARRRGRTARWRRWRRRWRHRGGLLFPTPLLQSVRGPLVSTRIPSWHPPSSPLTSLREMRRVLGLERLDRFGSHALLMRLYYRNLLFVPQGGGRRGVTLLHSTTPRIGVMSSTSRSGDLPAVPIAVVHALQVHYFIVSLVLAPQRLEHGI